MLHHEQSIRAVGDHQLHCNPQVRVGGHHVLLEPKKEKVKTSPEPTQQELVVIASEDARLSNTVDVGQVFRTRLVRDAHGRSTAPYCKQ